jgi:hypothetical protein
MQIKDFINNLNRYYWEIIQEENYPDGLKLPDKRVDSLIHFCGYAFEWSGGPKIYQDAAKDVFDKNRVWLEETDWSNEIEKELWESFKNYCIKNKSGKKKVKFNKKHNPMYFSPENRELISLVKFSFLETNGEPISQWALNLIENNDLPTAFESLKKIRGVGDKIASFYLRDIYLLSNKKYKINPKDRYLLQPIDIWTRRAGRVLMGKPDLKDKLKDRLYAEALSDFEDAFKLAHGSSNAAFWVFGSQFTGNETVFAQIVKAIFKNKIQALNDKRKQIIGKDEKISEILNKIYITCD